VRSRNEHWTTAVCTAQDDGDSDASRRYCAPEAAASCSVQRSRDSDAIANQGLSDWQFARDFLFHMNDENKNSG